MKHINLFLFVGLITAPNLAQAYSSDNVEALFGKKRVRVVEALDCPGSDRLQWREGFEWRMNGDQWPDDRTTGFADRLRAQSRTTSRMVTETLLGAGEDQKLGNSLMVRDGFYDRAALGLPATLHGCAVIPVAVYTEDQGTEEAFTVNEKAFLRMGPADRYGVRMRLNTVRPEVIRYVFDSRNSRKSAVERLRAHQRLNINTLTVGGVEIDVQSPQDTYVRDGILYQARLEDGGPRVTFTEQGALRAVYDYLSLNAEGYKEYKVNLNSRSGQVFNEDSEVRCEGSFSYRADGTLAQCARFFRESNGVERNFKPLPVAYSGVRYTEPSKDFPGDDYIFVDSRIGASGSDGRFLALNFNRKATAVYMKNGEPSCRDLTFTNEINPTNRTKEVRVVIPADCFGIAHVDWEK